MPMNNLPENLKSKFTHRKLSSTNRESTMPSALQSLSLSLSCLYMKQNVKKVITYNVIYTREVMTSRNHNSCSLPKAFCQFYSIWISSLSKLIISSSISQIIDIIIASQFKETFSSHNKLFTRSVLYNKTAQLPSISSAFNWSISAGR